MLHLIRRIASINYQFNTFLSPRQPLLNPKNYLTPHETIDNI